MPKEDLKLFPETLFDSLNTDLLFSVSCYVPIKGRVKLVFHIIYSFSSMDISEDTWICDIKLGNAARHFLTVDIYLYLWVWYFFIPNMHCYFAPPKSNIKSLYDSVNIWSQYIFIQTTQKCSRRSKGQGHLLVRTTFQNLELAKYK